MRRALAGSAAALLVAMGPLALLWAASPAEAMPLSTGHSLGAASAVPQLGGYSLSATGEGLRVTYEQPNLPLPANPSLEGDVGYSSATFESGPVGQSTASVLYPGQVVVASGSQLGAIVPGAPALPDWPVQAHATYPTGSGTAKDDQGPMTMEAGSSSGGSSASADMGTPSGTAAVPAGVLTAQSAGSTSRAGVHAGVATATATASMHDVKVAGGVVEVTSARSAVTERSDGERASCSASSTITGVTVAGQPVTVDSSGVHAAGHDLPIGLFSLTPQQVLQMAGLSIRVTSPKKTSTGPAGTCSTSALDIQLDLAKFDADAAQLVTALPSQLASVVYQLPLPVPDSQVLTFDLGDVSVQAAASPAFVPPPFPPPKPPGGGSSAPQPPLPAGPSSSTPSVPGVMVPPTSPASGTSPASSSPSGTSALGGSTPIDQGVPAVASRPAALTRPTVPTSFKGLGALPVGLGLAGATGLALAVTRMDRKVLAGAKRMVCAVRPGSGGGAASAAAGAGAGAGAGGKPWPVGRAAPVAPVAPPPGTSAASTKGARF